MSSLWGQYQNPLAATIPISSASIRLDFPSGRYLVDAPKVFVTVSGGPTEVTISYPKEAVAGFGEVHTHVALDFPVELVGLVAHVWVMGP